jgi:anti-sigma B factor antagonist
MADSLLNIGIEKHRRVDVISVTGRIDSNSAREFDAALKGVLESSRHNIVLELAQVDYMSSAGLRAMVVALRECKKKGGDVRLGPLSERVSEVLSLAGLDSLFQVYKDTTAAVGSF